MESITSRQAEFLLFFAARAGKNASITAAAEKFGVTKPTVCRISAALETMEFIQKNSGGEVRLTEKGTAYIRPLQEREGGVSQWLISTMGLSPDLAEAEARKIVVELHHDTVSAILEAWERQRQSMPALPQSPLFGHLQPGAYPVPFFVQKKHAAERSMGDSGFRKPAILVRRRDDVQLRLFTRELEYRPAQRIKTCYGTLERLWYRCGGVWVEAATGKDGSFLLPACAITLRGEYGGCVAIRVRATVEQWAMPESEADLILDLSGLVNPDNGSL